MSLERALHLVDDAANILEGLRLSVLEEVTGGDQEMVDLEQVLLDAITEVGVMKGLLVNKMNT